MKNKLICVIGPDGTGKSTQVNLLINSLNKKGIKYEYQWLRFHHFFSLPVLAMARLIGLSEVKTLENGGRIGYHYFYKSKIISFLYSTSLLFDTVIFTILKVYIPIYILKKNIIYDRFVYDTLIDLMISTGNYETYRKITGKLFTKLVPKRSNIIMLLTNETALKNRREDIKHDKSLILRIKLYRQLSKIYNIKTVDASLSIDEIQNKIKENIELKP